MRIHRPESGLIETSGTSRVKSHGQGCILGKEGDKYSKYLSTDNG